MTKPDAREGDYARSFETVRRAYRQRLEGQTVDIAQLWASQAGDADWETAGRPLYGRLSGLLHSVTGSAGTFGYAEISQAAAPAEQLVRGIADAPTPPAADIVAQTGRYLDHLLQTMRAALADDAAVVRMPVVGDPEPGTRRLLLLEPDERAAAGLAGVLGQFGYRVHRVSDLAEAADSLASAPPAAMLLDMAAVSGGLAGADPVERFSATVPLVVISERADFDARLSAARAGAAAYLVKPADTDELVGWLDRLTGQDAQDPIRVLIVDDDRLLAETYALTLSGAGMRPRVLTDPRGILEVLEHGRPDVILMDIYMPGCLGVHLARVVRQFRELVSVPIMFLSTERDPARQLHATSQGGDDFLVKPIDPGHLTMAVASRAERARALRAAMDRDSLTGLLNHGRIKERLAVELARAQRGGHQMAFALLDLDHFKRVNDTYGHQTGDAVLKGLARLLTRRLRRSDVIGRYGGEEFAVILPETDGGSAWAVMESLRSAFSALPFAADGAPFTVTFSCGLCVASGDTTMDAMIERADAALYAAKRDGRNRVVLADGEGKRPGSSGGLRQMFGAATDDQ